MILYTLILLYTQTLIRFLFFLKKISNGCQHYSIDSGFNRVLIYNFIILRQIVQKLILLLCVLILIVIQYYGSITLIL